MASSLAGHILGMEGLHEFAHLRDAVVTVTGAISEARSHLQQVSEESVHLEVEGRLGVLTDQGFVSDIGKDKFCALLHMLDAYPRWHHIVDWTDVQDVFYFMYVPSENSATRRLQVRTSVGVGADKQLAIVHTIKRKLKTVDLKLQPLDSEGHCMEVDTAASIEAVDARVCISAEQQLPPELLPVAVTPNLVRIKQRKQYRLHSLGVEKPAFSIDLTIVYTGKTKSEAEQKQANEVSPTYEVEVECLSTPAYLQSCSQKESILALSILLKLLDFAVALNPNQSVTYACKGAAGVH